MRSTGESNAEIAEGAEQNKIEADPAGFLKERMTRIGTIGLLAGVAFSAACWSSSEPANNGAATSPTPSSNAVVAAPGQTVQPMPTIDLPAATSNRVLSGDSVADRANRAPHGNANPDAKPEELKFTPAPEDSQAALRMEPNGVIYEVRIFRKHPKLARVEAWSDGDSAKDVTITFRDGRVSKVRTGRIPNLAAMGSAWLLDVATNP